jgi:hypothetical protein
MRILLQQTGTARYLKTLEIWTSNPLEAFDFYQSERAMNFATEQHLSDIEVVAFPEGGPAKMAATPFTDVPTRRQSAV